MIMSWKWIVCSKNGDMVGNHHKSLGKCKVMAVKTKEIRIMESAFWKWEQQSLVVESWGREIPDLTDWWPYCFMWWRFWSRNSLGRRVKNEESVWGVWCEASRDVKFILHTSAQWLLMTLTHIVHLHRDRHCGKVFSCANSYNVL